MNHSFLPAPDFHGPSANHEEALHAFLNDKRFPCVAAKSALNKGRIQFANYPSMTSAAVFADLCGRLHAFSKIHPDPGHLPVSFIAMFGDAPPDEAAFERSLWALLQALHEHDRNAFDWDASVGSDPAQGDFSFSIAGRALFVVGMHPAASRLARRTPMPCVVFNFHNQFESLKASGKYAGMQAAIRARDVLLQGSINPVLARFGEASEARQYAGRAVESNWRCPFHAKEAALV